jgi:DHA3 family macrolide efflux protein-like MFS transporter
MTIIDDHPQSPASVPEATSEATSETTSETPGPPLGRRFLTIWSGQTISTVGSALSGIGIAVYVYVTTGSLLWLGLLTAFETLPILLTSPLLRFTDRFDRRSVMIWADAVAAIGPAIALMIALVGDLQPWHLALAGFAGGLGTSFQVPAYQAALPHLVERDAIDRANGLVQLGPAAALVLGPAIATPIVAWWGIEAILIADLVSFMIGAGATVLTPFSAVVEPSDDDDGSNRAAFAWLRGPGRPLLTLLAAIAAINLVMAFFNLAFFALAVELGGVARAGLVPALGGVTMIAVSLAMGKRGVPAQRIRAVATAVGMMAIACVVAAVQPSFVLLLVGTVLALATVPVANAAVSTMFHEHVPANMHGRVFGLRNVIGQMLYPFGATCAGLVGAHLAAPAMSEGGVLAGTLGRVIGVGPDRGPALIMLGVAAALAMTMLVVVNSSALRQLKDETVV